MIEIEYSKRGIPCVWESGGGSTNTGEATIVTSALGQPKRPIYIRTGGNLACGKHALIPVAEGDYVLRFSHHRRDFHISILTFHEGGLKNVAEFSNGEWDENENDLLFLSEAISVGKEKATTYHCREPKYIVN